MNNNNLEVATLGGGCFWCTEAIYQLTKGIVTVEAGYSGGHVENPTYEQVCSKTTGHVEVIRIEYDSKEISYSAILDIFWKTHNPTTIDRQGNDVGPQYRSAIFYHNNEQKEIAEASLRATDATDLWADPIVTVIEPLTNYYVAENYHQNYFNQNKDKNPYCSAVVKPKVEKFVKENKAVLK
ncbi:MAG: peptide-methionine (S)-S-oxide reductase MsrA [Saprospiraceae bacterium]